MGVSPPAIAARVRAAQTSERFTVEASALSRSFAAAVHDGLGREHRSLPPCFFYDERGSRLFDRICEQPEYYPFRTESEILARHAAELSRDPRPRTVAELGCGYAHKTRLVLDAVSH